MKIQRGIFYKARHGERQVVKSSSSGGVFTALSDEILREGGIVYGCVLDSELKARHIRAGDAVGRNRMRGSKYIQSRIDSSTYAAVAEDLKARKAVLFTGTPCQISALLSFLTLKNVDTEPLYTVECLCHGVASTRFFRDYVRHLEERFHGKALSCNFRAKRGAGQKQDMLVEFSNGKRYHASSTNYDWFYSVYHQFPSF